MNVKYYFNIFREYFSLVGNMLKPLGISEGLRDSISGKALFQQDHLAGSGKIAHRGAIEIDA